MLRFWVWGGSIVSTMELFLYVWEKEESKEILVAELLEKKMVDQEEEEVIVYKKGWGKVLGVVCVQVHVG